MERKNERKAGRRTERVILRQNLLIEGDLEKFSKDLKKE